MTFFYDLNKKLAGIDKPAQPLTEGAVAEASYSAKAARAGKDIGKPGKNFEKIAKSAGERYGSKERGEKVAGAVLAKLRAKESVEEAYAPSPGNIHDPYGDEASPEQHKAYQDELNLYKTPGAHPALASMGMSRAQGVHDRLNKVLAKKQPGMAEEGGTPMTPKQKAFAKLAPPKDKITFADKIAGAKQEVDEMLGDVAAEAMKSALKGGQKKLDVNHNGKIDAGDFAILRNRKGGKQVADEGWDEMEKDVKRRMGPKVGDVRRGARHDIETTATGIKATRRYDDEEQDDQPAGEKRGRGRPKGAPKGPERVTAKAYKHKGGRKTNEGDVAITDQGEYDQEGAMAKDDIKTIVRHAQALEKILGDNDNLPEWVQAKLAKIEGMMTAVDDYMQNQDDSGGEELDQGEDLEESATFSGSEVQQAYRLAVMLKNFVSDPDGQKVAADLIKLLRYKLDQSNETLKEKAVSQQQQKFMGMAHAIQKGEKVKGASKELKKVARTMKPKDVEDFAATKHEGLPKKAKKKEESVEETTSSGSVATGGDAPKKSKGGVQIGKGIYDSLNREVEGMIAESMSINVSSDSEGHKNITVTAGEEDAEMLAQLLRRAGLGGGESHGHEEPCPDCGSTDCGCDESMAEAYGDTTATENKPDWPTNTEYSDDALQYSGGLNKPKTDVAGDGQTTIPNTAVHTQNEDELRRMMEMAGIDQSLLKPWQQTMKEEDAVEEGVVDAVKGVVKKGLEKLGHGSDEEMIKDLQKKTGVEPTGKKPEAKDDKKMQESLMAEFANFKI